MAECNTHTNGDEQMAAFLEVLNRIAVALERQIDALDSLGQEIAYLGQEIGYAGGSKE